MGAAFLGTTTPDGWRTWETTNGQVVDRGVVVRRTLGTPTVVHGHDVERRAPPDETDTAGERERQVDSAVDVALDRCGRLYVLDDGGTIHRYDPDVGEYRHYDDFDRDRSPVEFARPRALCLLGGAMFVAIGGDEGDPGGLFVVPRESLVARPVVDVRPVDVVALTASDRQVYLLDAGGGPGEGRVIRVDPAGTTTPETVVEGLHAPRDVAVCDDGTLAVLDTVADGSGRFRLQVFTITRRDGTEALDPRVTADVDAGAEFDPTGLTVWVAEDDRPDHFGRVVVAGTDRSGRGQLRRYALAGDGVTFTTDDPLSVRPRRVLATTGGSGSPGQYYVVARDGTVVSVAEQVRTRLNERTGRFDATLVTRFDAGAVGTRWHRVTLDVAEETVGPGTRESSSQVRLRYGATDDSSVGTEPIEAVPGIGSTYASRLRRAGIETTLDLVEYDADALATIAASPSGPTALVRSKVTEWLAAADERTVSWQSTPAPDPRDTLVDAVGRYLWVELELVGSEYVSPRVDSLRAFFPRDSYLRYLPSLYRQDERSAAFLERYLSLPESGFDGLDVNVDSLTGSLDPGSVPSASLSWLGRWIGMETDETWPESVQRAFVSQAPELFRNRGTPHGLLAMLQLYLDRTLDASAEPPADDGSASAPDADGATDSDDELTPAAIETDVSRALALWEHADLDVIERAGARAAYGRLVNSPVGFIVLAGPDVTDEEFDALERLVATETPAHTVGRIVRLTPWIRLGGHSYLGLNTTLAPRAFVVDRTVLGVDSMLWARYDGAGDPSQTY